MSRNHLSRILCLSVLLAALTPAFAQSPTWTNDPAIESRISALIQQMTLEEKIGQLNQFSGASGHGHSDYRQMIAAGQIGSLLNVTGAKETNELQRVAVTQSRLKIPILFGSDVIHGYHTVFPVPLALACTWDTDLIQKTAAAAAREVSAEGIRWTFSPMVDIARDARWGRIVEGAGEDPYLGSLIAQAYIRGYQGARLNDPTSIAACAKHYVGYGAAEAGRDYNTTEIPERLLRQIYLPPFRAAVDAGVATLMSAFNALNEVPATANSFTLDQILRREWGFKGLVVSDYAAVEELIAHGIANDGATAARKALTAGLDMDMESGLFLSELTALVKAGKVPMQAIEEAVRRILRVKAALGLFDRPFSPESDPPGRLDPAHVELARTAAEESFVLLKNRADVLPVGSGVRTLALIGPLADDSANMLGSWAGKGDPKDVINLRSALTDYTASHQMRLLYQKGTEIVGGSEDGIRAAVDAARTADLVLLALGEDASQMTGEAASRAFITLPGIQEKLVDSVASAGKPVVLIVFSGRPLALTSVADRVAAIVQAWYPGVQAGPALVRILTGEANFSGRLTVSMPRSVGQEPLYYSHLDTGRPADDPGFPPIKGLEKFRSRYIDEQNAPLFPFGCGLSYTHFEYSAVTASTQSLSAEALNSGSQVVHVSAQVRNTGNRDGVEVVQLYIGQRGTSVARPVRELKGFERIALRAGEAKRVEFALGKKELAFWNIDMKEVVEPATVTVWVGPDSRTGNSTKFMITE